jgi:hypothetical protein
VATSTRLPRIDRSPRTAALAAGDALAMAAFVYAGEVQHGFPPTSYPGRFAGTLAPFLLGWVAVALVAGLYATDATATLRGTLTRTVPAWLAGILVAHALRLTPLFHGGTTPAFVLVSAVVGGALVVGWRSLVAVVGAG